MILLTARGEESDRLVGLRHGADDYVVKPFSPAELVARVDAVLRRVSPPAEEAAPPIEHGPLRIEPATRRVILDGEELSLTQREFDLLAYLAAHPGRVYSRDQLMEAVWGEPFFDGHQHRHRPRPPPPRQARRRPGRAALHRDGLGRRLQVAAVKRARRHRRRRLPRRRRRGRGARPDGRRRRSCWSLLAAGAAPRWPRRSRCAWRWRSARAREIEEARRQLVAAASHDLRTPLASLRLLVESIDDGVATGETRDRYLSEIRTHVGVAQRPDRRPLRALADRGRGHLLDDAPGRAAAT